MEGSRLRVTSDLQIWSLKTQDLNKLDQYPLHLQGKIVSRILNSIPPLYLLKEKDSICFLISQI